MKKQVLNENKEEAVQTETIPVVPEEQVAPEIAAEPAKPATAKKKPAK